MSTDVLNAPAAPAAPLATVKRIAIVPAFNEERNVGRVLDEHTYRHRARRLLELVGVGVEARVD